MSDLPFISVAATKFYEGANDLRAQGYPALDILPFEKAFESAYQTDAHFFQYEVMGTALARWPRINKRGPMLRLLREKGADVVATTLVLEFDNPGHADTPPGQVGRDLQGAWLAQLSKISEDWPTAWQWALCYFTRAGSRLVYVLTEPIPVDKVEVFHIGLCQQFRKHGMFPDMRCSDWSRCFRLPFVKRDGVATWEQDYAAEFLPQYNQRLDSKTLVAAETTREAQEYGQIKMLTNPQPKDGEAITPPGLWKEAKRRLVGRDCFKCIFEHMPIAEKGNRDNTIMRYVGQAVGLLIRVHGCTPEGIYSLFYSAVEQLEPDRDTKDWKAILWSCVTRVWALEQAKWDVELAIEEKKRADVKSALTNIGYGMRKWCKAMELFDDNDAVIERWVSQHLIISTGKTFLMMGPDGYYISTQIQYNQIIAAINMSHLKDLIPTQRQTSNGGVQEISIQTIINNYCTISTHIRTMPEIEGAFIEHIDTPNAQVVIPAYCRSKNLQPEYNADVDTWLQKLFGDQYDLGKKWIGWALAWDEGPICALSMSGAAGVGKKMLAQGLCETLQLPKMASTSDLSDVSYKLVQSPFLVVDEGWPKQRSGRHVADTFRSFVSGDIGSVRRLYEAPVDIKSPVRFLFTANNLDVVKMLSEGRDLSPDDQRALSIRLLHVDISAQAEEWLRLRGGYIHTAGWIEGDSGKPSQYVVARHFLWLHQERKGPVGARFLVEGNNAQNIMFDMRTRSGNSPIFFETIIRLFNSQSTRHDMRYEGIAVEDGEIYVTYDCVLTFFREELKHLTNDHLTPRAVTNGLVGLMKAAPKLKVLKTKNKLGKKMWYCLDTVLLLRVATINGMDTAKLEQLVEEQNARLEGRFDASVAMSLLPPTENKTGNVYSIADALALGNKKEGTA